MIAHAGGVNIFRCLSSPWPWFYSRRWRSIYFKGFSLADHTLPTHPEPAWLKMAQAPLNGTTKTVDSEEEGLHPTTGRQWLKEKGFAQRWAWVFRLYGHFHHHIKQPLSSED